MSSATDKISGYANEAIGTIKQNIGNRTDSTKLQAEGKVQELKGEAQKTTAEVKNAISSAADKISDTFK